MLSKWEKSKNTNDRVSEGSQIIGKTKNGPDIKVERCFELKVERY